jgi:hypothetical protein
MEKNFRFKQTASQRRAAQNRIRNQRRKVQEEAEKRRTTAQEEKHQIEETGKEKECLAEESRAVLTTEQRSAQAAKKIRLALRKQRLVKFEKQKAAEKDRQKQLQNEEEREANISEKILKRDIDLEFLRKRSPGKSTTSQNVEQRQETNDSPPERDIIDAFLSGFSCFLSTPSDDQRDNVIEQASHKLIKCTKEEVVHTKTSIHTKDAVEEAGKVTEQPKGEDQKKENNIFHTSIHKRKERELLRPVNRDSKDFDEWIMHATKVLDWTNKKIFQYEERTIGTDIQSVALLCLAVPFLFRIIACISSSLSVSFRFFLFLTGGR